jgi:hypothetical protein
VHLEINVLNVMLKGVTVVMGVMVAGLKLAMSVPGGSCVAEIIGNECGGSTGSNEPRGGKAGDGGNGGDAVIFGNKNSINRNTTDIVNTTETG